MKSCFFQELQLQQLQVAMRSIRQCLLLVVRRKIIVAATKLTQQHNVEDATTTYATHATINMVPTTTKHLQQQQLDVVVVENIYF